jgi:hypothetical protein
VGGWACDQRSRVLAGPGRRTACLHAPRIHTTSRTCGALLAGPEPSAGGRALMDSGACRAVVESKPCTGGVEPSTRRTDGGASARGSTGR